MSVIAGFEKKVPFTFNRSENAKQSLGMKDD